MNTLLALFISTMTFLSPPIDAPTDPVVDNNVMESYCNARYDFCVEYPSNVFVNEMTSTNADGVLLTSPKEEVTMAVYGEYNALGLTLEGQHKFLLNTIAQSHGLIEDHLTIFTENSFTSNIELDGLNVELRCQKVNSHFITVIIKSIDNDNLQYSNLTDEVNIKIVL